MRTKKDYIFDFAILAVVIILTIIDFTYNDVKAAEVITSDLYNNDYSEKNLTTGIPVGYHKEYITSNKVNGPANIVITNKVGTSGFRVNYITYTTCNPGRRVVCRDIPMVKIKKVATNFNGYGFLALNTGKLQKVTPGTVRRFADVTKCTAAMPVIIKYYDINKNLLKVNTSKGLSFVQEFSQYTKPTDTWAYNTFRHGIPLNVHYIHIGRAITNNTNIGGSCIIAETHDKISK